MKATQYSFPIDKRQGRLGKPDFSADASPPETKPNLLFLWLGFGSGRFRGAWRRGFGGGLNRVVLVVEFDDVLGYVHCVRGVDHGSLLRGVVENHRVAVLPRVLIQNCDEFAAEGVDQVLPRFLIVVARLRLFALKIAGQGIAFAREAVLLIIGESIRVGLQPRTDVLYLLLNVLKFRLPRRELGG